MSEREYNTIRNLRLSEIFEPQHLTELLEYVGELAPPCVAEALMNRLNPTPRKLSLLIDADVDFLIKKRADDLHISTRRVVEELIFREFKSELAQLDRASSARM